MIYTLFYLVVVKPSSVEDSQATDHSQASTAAGSVMSQLGSGSVPPGGPPSDSSVTADGTSQASATSTATAAGNDGMPKMYLKVQALIEIDMFVATRNVRR